MPTLWPLGENIDSEVSLKGLDDTKRSIELEWYLWNNH